MYPVFTCSPPALGDVRGDGVGRLLDLPSLVRIVAEHKKNRLAELLARRHELDAAGQQELRRLLQQDDPSPPEA